MFDFARNLEDFPPCDVTSGRRDVLWRTRIGRWMIVVNRVAGFGSSSCFFFFREARSLLLEILLICTISALLTRLFGCRDDICARTGSLEIQGRCWKGVRTWEREIVRGQENSPLVDGTTDPGSVNGVPLSTVSTSIEPRLFWVHEDSILTIELLGLRISLKWSQILCDYYYPVWDIDVRFRIVNTEWPW